MKAGQQLINKKRDKIKVTDLSHIVEPVGLNSLIKYSVEDMKACKREEACSSTTKANHEVTEQKIISKCW